MTVRDALVGGFGLKTAAQRTSPNAENRAARIGIFRIYGTSKTEVILGADDTHFDVRLPVLCAGPSVAGDPHRLTLSTVAHCHHRLGRLSLFLIAPFQRLIVKSSLRSAARIGWPRAAPP